ncbi:MAG: hypothetical protein J6Y78_15325 [Paludibacteraceae bacterium]|nr:hypothetical protein [Paludibacteraceae bacterium]
MASNTTTIHKLQQAINSRGGKVLYSTSQFYSDKQERPVTMYSIKQAYYDEDAGKHRSIELYKTTSQIQIVLFLRDMWFEMNGWEIPTDNEEWNKAKAKGGMSYDKRAESET